MALKEELEAAKLTNEETSELNCNMQCGISQVKFDITIMEPLYNEHFKTRYFWPPLAIYKRFFS